MFTFRLSLQQKCDQADIFADGFELPLKATFGYIIEELPEPLAERPDPVYGGQYFAHQRCHRRRTITKTEINLKLYLLTVGDYR